MFSVISYLYVIYHSDRYILYCSMKDKGPACSKHSESYWTKVLSCKLCQNSVYVIKGFLMKMPFSWHIITQQTKGLIPDALKVTHVLFCHNFDILP